MTTSGSRFLQVQEHRTSVDGDVLSVCLQGPLSPAQALQLLSFAEGQLGPAPRFFLLLDLRQLESPPESESRRLLVQWTKERSPLATAAVGGNPIVRALATLSSRASDLLSGHHRPLQFFASIEQAYAWFATFRDGQPAPHSR